MRRKELSGCLGVGLIITGVVMFILLNPEMFFTTLK